MRKHLCKFLAKLTLLFTTRRLTAESCPANVRSCWGLARVSIGESGRGGGETTTDSGFFSLSKTSRRGWCLVSSSFVFSAAHFTIQSGVTIFSLSECRRAQSYFGWRDDERWKKLWNTPYRGISHTWRKPRDCGGESILVVKLCSRCSGSGR